MNGGSEKFGSKMSEKVIPDARLQLIRSPHGLPAVEIKDAAPAVRAAVKAMLSSNFIDDPSYMLRKKVGAFLQVDTDSSLLIEFWNGDESDQQDFVKHLTAVLNKEA